MHVKVLSKLIFVHSWTSAAGSRDGDWDGWADTPPAPHTHHSNTDNLASVEAERELEITPVSPLGRMVTIHLSAPTPAHLLKQRYFKKYSNS